MKIASTHPGKPVAGRWIAAWAVTLLGSWLAGTAAAEIPGPDELRLVTGARKFDDTQQLAFAYRLGPSRRLHAHHIEFAIGTIYTDTDNRPFVALGPVWRLPVTGRSTFVDFGFSPTVLSGSRFDGRELGGNFHFTSRLAVGARFGRYRDISLALQAQHTSNGGIDATNPGLDMVGITVAVEFRD